MSQATTKIDYAGFLAKLTGSPEASEDPVERTADSGRNTPFEQTTGTVAPVTAYGIVADKTALASKLEATSKRAINKADEIMTIPLDPDSSHYGNVLRAQTAIVNTALTTQTRVDETRLRAEQVDVLPKLLKIMAEEAKKIPSQFRNGDEDET